MQVASGINASGINVSRLMVFCADDRSAQISKYLRQNREPLGANRRLEERALTTLEACQRRVGLCGPGCSQEDESAIARSTRLVVSWKVAGSALPAKRAAGGIPHSTTRLVARNDPMTTSTRWPRFTARVGFEKAIQ